MLDRTTLTPIPRFSATKDPGAVATSAVVDFPSNPKPSEGRLFPMSTKDLGSSIHNETEAQIASVRVTVRFDIYGEHERAVEKSFNMSREVTLGQATEDVATFLRLVQDQPLLQDEDFLVVSMAPRGSYQSVLRDSNKDETELTDREKMPKFLGENALLAVRNNVSDKDIEKTVLQIVDDLSAMNRVPFPENTAFGIVKDARLRFRASILNHVKANMAAKKIGEPKSLLRMQCLETEKVTVMIIIEE